MAVPIGYPVPLLIERENVEEDLEFCDQPSYFNCNAAVQLTGYLAIDPEAPDQWPQRQLRNLKLVNYLAFILSYYNYYLTDNLQARKSFHGLWFQIHPKWLPLAVPSEEAKLATCSVAPPS